MVQPGVNKAEKGTGSYARSVTNNALSETVFALATARTDGEQPDFVLWPENATDVDPMADATTRGLVELSTRLAGVPVFVGAVTDGPALRVSCHTSMPDNSRMRRTAVRMCSNG